MKQGDRIWYRQTCLGGYGFQRDVPAIFDWQGPKRATIRVQTSAGEKRIAVKPENLRSREESTQ
jgi:hypothetical protein